MTPRPLNLAVAGRWLVRAGIGLYPLSFLLPAQEFTLFTTNSFPGWAVFIGTIGSITNTLDGEIVWFFIWLANPLFWLSIALSRRGQPERAVLASAAALSLLIIGTLLIYEPHGIELVARDVPFSSLPPMVGAYAWTAGIGLAGVGWAIQTAVLKHTPVP